MLLQHQQLTPKDISVSGPDENEEALPEVALVLGSRRRAVASVPALFAFPPHASMEEGLESKPTEEEEEKAAEGPDGDNLLAETEGNSLSKSISCGLVDTVIRARIPFLQMNYPQLMTAVGAHAVDKGETLNPIVEDGINSNTEGTGIAVMNNHSAISSTSSVRRIFSESAKLSTEENKSNKIVVTRTDRCYSQYSNSSPDSRYSSVSEGTTRSDKGPTRSISKRLRKAAGRLMRAASVGRTSSTLRSAPLSNTLSATTTKE